jgi:hypothetical protein
MFSGFSQAFRFRLSALAIGAAMALSGAAAQPALATHFTQSPGGTDPLTIWVGTNGWFQELVAGNTDNSFFPRSQPTAGAGDTSADAGFVLAFPSAQAGASNDPIEGQVWGWTPSSGSNGLTFDGNFVPVSQGSTAVSNDGSWAGSGTTGDPYKLFTVYDVDPPGVTPALARVTQTTTYVNGESNFVNSYSVQNLTVDDLKFRALVGADVYLNGSDCGSGIFKEGPPRFVGGFSQGRVGGFTEAGTAWTRYFEGPYGGPPGTCELNPTGALGVWDYIEGAEAGVGFPSSPGSIDTNFVDNGIGIQWDTRFSTGLPAIQTQSFQLNTLGTVPGTLALTPPSQSVGAGTGVTLTAMGTTSTGTPAAGVTIRFTASGANAASGATTTNSSGQASFAYTPTTGGTDTVTAYEDIDGNGSRGSGEPTATATVAVAGPTAGGPGGGSGSSDKTPPKITLLVSSKAKLKKFLKGLSVAARVSESASLKIDLLGSRPKKKNAKSKARSKAKAKAFSVLLARQSLGMAGAGLRATRLKPSKKRIGKQKKFAVQLRVTATDRAGNKATATKRIKVR